MDNPYRHLAEYGDHIFPPEPDTLYIERGGHLLSFVQLNHTFDPASPQIDEIIDAWSVFIVSAKPEERIALREGKVMGMELADPATAIVLRGEMALLEYLAKIHHVPFESFDRKNKDEFQAVLQKGHEPAAILYYSAIRHQARYLGSFEAQKNGPLLDHLEDMLKVYKTYLPEELRPVFATISMNELHQLFFDRPFAECVYDPFFALDQTASLWETDTDIQKVAVEWNIYRDNNLLQVLRNLNKSAFIVLGWEHGYRLEEDFKMLGQPLNGADLPRDTNALQPLLHRLGRKDFVQPPYSLI